MSNDPRGYYADLGVSPTASTDEIKVVYRALAKIYHPDVNKDRAATDKFRRITEAYEVLSDERKRAAYDSSSVVGRPPAGAPSSASPQRAPTEPVQCSKCGKVTAQPRFLVFRQVVSFVVMTRIMPKLGIFCSECAGKVAFRASAISAAFGWWGFPWGPIYTVKEILRNAFGGERHPEIDEQLVWQNAVAFTDQRKYQLAGSLATLLQSAKDARIAAGAKQLAALLASNGQTFPRLRSPWKSNIRGGAGQVLMGCAVPVLAWVLVANPLGSTYTSYIPRLPTTTVAESPAETHPTLTPVNLCRRMPANGQILKQNIHLSENGHRLTIKNGSGGDAIVKLRSPERKLLASFYVKQNMTATFDGFPDGGYRVQFAFGGAMTQDCSSFVDPAASEFNGLQTFQTETTATQIITQQLSFTLYNVPGGNIRPTGISAADFNAD